MNTTIRHTDRPSDDVTSDSAGDDQNPQGEDPAAAASTAGGRSRWSRLAVILLSFTAIAVALVSTQISSASAATVPQASRAYCGWYSQHVALNSPYYYKITTSNLPQVTGTSSAQSLVTMKAMFYHPGASGPYRTGNFFTYAVAGRWTSSWTAYSNMVAGQTSVQDAGGESGYLGAEFVSQDTFVRFFVSWTGTSYTSDQWAYSTNSYNNHNVCNAGAGLN